MAPEYIAFANLLDKGDCQADTSFPIRRVNSISHRAGSAIFHRWRPVASTCLKASISASGPLPFSTNTSTTSRMDAGKDG